MFITMLYVVSTPIGNLKDITFRAVEVLKQSDYILAEDTRRTAKLLKHYGIEKKLVSYNDMNKERKTPAIINELKHKDISLVSDAGTPGISDPGFYLVRECIKNDIQVSPVPGATALISALTCSGFPTDRFTFFGFMPKKELQKKKLLAQIEHTAIFYESPHRVIKTLKLIESSYPKKQVVLARELTKKFESFYRGTAKEILEELKTPKGEFVLILG